MTYYVKYNDPEVPGGKQCVDKVDAMLKEFARQKRCEDEKKAKEACEDSAATLCNAHGKPIYESGCSNNNAWIPGAENTGSNNNEDACDKATAQYNCRNTNKFGQGVASRCNRCACESTFEGAHCTRAFKWTPRWSRSVGDPHPNTFNGKYTNLYDGGEFIWWRYPDIPMEAHLTTVPKWGVAVNKEFSVKRCKSVKKTKACTGAHCYPDMVAPCEVITAGRSTSTYSIKADGTVVCNKLLWNCVVRSGSTLVRRYFFFLKHVFFTIKRSDKNTFLFFFFSSLTLTLSFGTIVYKKLRRNVRIQQCIYAN